MPRKQSQSRLVLERGAPIHLVASTRGHSSVATTGALSAHAADRQLGALPSGVMRSHRPGQRRKWGETDHEHWDTRDRQSRGGALTRADVEAMLAQVSDSSQLDLRHRRMTGIDLSGMDLVRANLSGADLRGANLSGADLNGANLSEANLSEANLRDANLSGADLRKVILIKAILSGLDLRGFDLRGAYLSRADLREANLIRADLRGLDLRGLDLGGAKLSGANLRDAILNAAKLRGAKLSNTILNGADLREADLSGTNLEGAEISGAQVEEILLPGAHRGRLQLQFAEEPLTAQSLSTLVTALTDLHTHCWLIQAGRFEDLARYGITHDRELVREANLVVASVSKQSPLEIKAEVKADLSPQALADAMKTGIESVALISARRKQAELENRGRELELEIKELEAEQTAAQREQERELQRREREQELDLQRRERELAQGQTELELERKRLELEQMRLQLLEQRLQVGARVMEAAAKLVPMLYPNASDDARPMLVQSLVPSLLQFSELSIRAEITVSTSRPVLPESGTDQAKPDQA
jgi:uncharacterized protein YjbI with pentapeptide repeats